MAYSQNVDENEMFEASSPLDFTKRDAVTTAIDLFHLRLAKTVDETKDLVGKLCMGCVYSNGSQRSKLF